MHRVAIKRYFLFVCHCGVIRKNSDQHTHCTGVLMPHSLYATDTDLTADN
ncbi:diaminopimelate decarboxylase, partial [Klebsiella pneumoniae]